MSLAGWRDWRIGRSGLPEFVGLVLIGLYMAAVAAFGSDNAPEPLRYAYWLVVMVGGGVIAALIEPWLAKIGWRWSPLFAAAQALVMTPPIAVFVWLMSGLMFGGRLSLMHLVTVLPSVLIVDVAVVVLAWLVRRAYRKPESRPVPAHIAPPAIRDRLPPRLARAELHAVQSEDHYLRIHTSAGNDLILMKLADALEALQDADGMQVHRSWWVARRAVEHARWSRGRGELELKGGLKVPVSTRYAAAVKQTDWA
jgi:hypothetical protein